MDKKSGKSRGAVRARTRIELAGHKSTEKNFASRTSPGPMAGSAPPRAGWPRGLL